jgi:hypothetical protein
MAVPGRPGAVIAGPALTAGSGLFDGEGRPLVVRLEVPLSAGEMVAALYGEYERLTQADLGTGEDGRVAVRRGGGRPGRHACDRAASRRDRRARAVPLAGRA